MSLLLVLFITFISVLDLFHFGLPPTHDGEYHIMRIWQFHKGIVEGNLYPLWAPDFNNGYGIPLFNYVYPLPNYIGSLFHIIGLSLIDSYKLTMILGSMIGGVFMYLFIKERLSDTSGIVASVFYTFAPYHLLDIYVRGSVGEVMALGIYPIVFWSFEKVISTSRTRYFVTCVLSITLLILSHNILALIFVPLFVFIEGFYIFLEKKRKNIVGLIVCVCLGVGLASPFWIPAIFESGYVQGLQFSVPTDHFPVIYKLIYSSWGYGFSGSGGEGQMSFQIGIVNLLVVLLVFSTAVLKRKMRREVIFFTSILVTMVFLMTPMSSFLWLGVPFANYIQFPWRLLSVVIFVISIMAGILVSKAFFGKKIVRILAVCLIILSIGFCANYIKAPFYHARDDSHYLKRSNFTDGTNSPGDSFNTIWINKIPESKERITSVNARVENIEIKSHDYKFKVLSDGSELITINTAFFPFWKATINDKSLPINNEKGVMAIRIEKGESDVHMYIGSTFVRSISNVFFFLSIIFLIGLTLSPIAIIKNRNENRN